MVVRADRDGRAGISARPTPVRLPLGARVRSAGWDSRPVDLPHLADGDRCTATVTSDVTIPGRRRPRT